MCTSFMMDMSEHVDAVTGDIGRRIISRVSLFFGTIRALEEILCIGLHPETLGSRNEGKFRVLPYLPYPPNGSVLCTVYMHVYMYYYIDVFAYIVYIHTYIRMHVYLHTGQCTLL